MEKQIILSTRDQILAKFKPNICPNCTSGRGLPRNGQVEKCRCGNIVIFDRNKTVWQVATIAMINLEAIPEKFLIAIEPALIKQ